MEIPTPAKSRCIISDRTADVARTALPQASLRDTLATLAEVIVPTLGKGVIIRRPPMVALAERRELDSRAVRRVQRLFDTYGAGPLRLRNPVRPQVIVLAPEHVHRILGDSPEPFATRSSEKHAALSHFQPRGALISHGPDRAVRRRYNEEVLDMQRPMHRLADAFQRVVADEAAGLLERVAPTGELAWPAFAETWFRVVRRVVFGEAARDDEALTGMLARLRADANWAFLKPKRHELRRRFFARMEHYLARAEPDSLAGVMARMHADDVTAPAHQVPQWLFAFDPAGMTTFRALALLASHPVPRCRAEDDVAAEHVDARRPFLRACVLESLRLWPTTPIVLRQSVEETQWENGVMPAGTGILIYAPYFHRDERHLPYAHHFTPELWLEERTADDWPLIPFSGGPARCPGQNLVLMLSSAMLAALLRDRHLRLEPPDRLDPGAPLPGTLNNYDLRFRLEA